MKTIFLFLFFITVNFMFPDNIKIIKTINCYNQFENKKNISIIEYQNKIGFKIDLIYILVDQKTFFRTLKENKRNFKWHVYSKCNTEILMVRHYIYVLSLFDKFTNTLELILTADDFLNPAINYIYFKFNKNDLEDFE
jgi:hypothetical protein